MKSQVDILFCHIFAINMTNSSQENCAFSFRWLAALGFVMATGTTNWPTVLDHVCQLVDDMKRSYMSLVARTLFSSILAILWDSVTRAQQWQKEIQLSVSSFAHATNPVVRNGKRNFSYPYQVLLINSPERGK
ncbi:hypothetical protein Salat_2497500 [Sesamum alatum]|uniref:Uncharacterized protein n=1 Tax=Sesamum alatum TaxID=300844 RepID=A0AAE2CC90_9LAMI|nr:hypothetical protein Salat_2497500 [Sesamum alatum]